MKNLIIFLLAVFVIITQTFAQTFKVFYPSNNVGFGKNFKCSSLMTLVVNGPLWNIDGTPVGGYVDNGKQVKPWKIPNSGVDDNFNNKNGIFGLKQDGTMCLIPYEKWDGSIQLKWGFQNGSILILNGNNLCNPASKNFCERSGIGYRLDGSLVVIVSTQLVTFWALAEEFVRQGCNNAIYLDGFGLLNSPQSPVGYASYNGDVHGLQPNTIKLQFFK